MEIKSQALIFPGQGSQKIGMGKSLYDNFAIAREVFARIDEALHYNLSKLMFEGNAEELNQTQNAQPAIMAVSMAYFAVFKETGLLDTDNVKFAAGHSLGEYSALCAAEAIDLENVAKLLQLRGKYMMEACQLHKGAMAAIIGLDLASVNQIAALNNCYVGNSNAPLQIVISGGENEVTKASAEAVNSGARKAIMLNVSGAFHSPLMQKAADMMADVIEQAKISVPQIQVISNMTARPYDSINEIKQLLKEQITNTVKWQESVRYINDNNVDEFVEIGFGNVLSGLVKKIAPEAKILTADEMVKQLKE